MTRLFPLSLALVMLTLAGCGQESSDSPEDGRDFNVDGYQQPNSYSGVVIDDYLRNARVWLDIDGDFQYTAGEMTVATPGGGTVTLKNGEPTAMTSEGGLYTLDISELNQDALVSADLDPRDYPVMVLALPGQTVDEVAGGGQVIEQAFMMSAPKGVRTITPLTTLLRFRQLAGLNSQFGESEALEAAFRDVNLLRDYLQAGDAQRHAYARAFVRYMAAQFPATANDTLRNGDGTERVLTPEGSQLLAVSFARNAAAVVEQVDAAAPAGHYENVDIDALALDVEVLDLQNPVVISEQVIFAHASNGSLPAARTSIGESARLSFRYSGEGQLLSVDADGCMQPSLRELARLVNAGGYMAATDIQWLPSVAFSQDSKSFLDSPGVDERLTFDWDNNQATFETTTSCHAGLTASADLGGAPAVTYQWNLAGDKVSSITDGELILEPDYAFESSAFWGYRLNGSGGELETLALSGARVSCLASATAEDLLKARLLTAKQAYSIVGYDPQPAGFTGLHLGFDERDGRDRLINFGFLDPEIASTLILDNYAGFEWSFHYQRDNVIIDDSQPNLISEAFLVSYGGERACPSDLSDRPERSLLAYVSSSYARLSDVLAGAIGQ